MELVGRVFNTVSEFYKDLNPSTLSGAIDIVVVELPDGSLSCSPFHVRFGKMHLLRPQEKKVEMSVNGKSTSFPMKVGEAGEAFFVAETNDPVPSDMETSPLSLPQSIPLEKGPEPLDLDKFIEKSDGRLNERRIPVESQTVMTVSNLKKLHIAQGESTGKSGPILLSDAEDVASGFVSPKSGLNNSNEETSVGTIEQLEQKVEGPAIQVETSGQTAAIDVFQSRSAAIPSDKLSRPDVVYPYSDTEIELGTSPEPTHWDKPMNDKLMAPFPMSDSEMDYADDGYNLQSQRWKWKWGNLPSKASSKSSMTVIESSDPDDGHDKSVVNTIIDVDLSATPFSSSVWEMSLCGPNLKKENAFEIFNEFKVTYEIFTSSPDILNNPNLVFRFKNKSYYTWKFVAPLIVSHTLFEKSPRVESLKSNLKGLESESSRKSSMNDGWKGWWSRNTNAQMQSPPFDQGTGNETVQNDMKFNSPKRYTKTLRLTSDQLRSLNLAYGANDVSFTVLSSFSGKATCTARIFLWKHDVSIVISDIDGTITKSDALGHLFNLVGKDWTHSGIANLYTNIHRNGYEFLFLTSRAIGQADWTRMYLRGIEQGSYILPDGPVIMSPDRLMAALKREVIDRRPEEFKIAALTDIRKLFGGGNPFYAGFGNRITDALSYRAVDIPAYRIYSIDPNGNVKMDFFYGYSSSYLKLADLVDHIFPHLYDAKVVTQQKENVELEKRYERSPSLQIESLDNAKRPDSSEEFNDYHFWRPAVKLPDIQENDADKGYSTDYDDEDIELGPSTQFKDTALRKNPLFPK